MGEQGDASDRPFDVVLFGATGFTGAIVAEHLLAHGPQDLRWALAGRSRPRLEAVRDELASRFPAAAALPVLVADAHDRSALDALVSRARAVASTVGPYARHGERLVAACAAAGTHYADLTGEVAFIRRMIDAHEGEARATGARLVHCCGFDSIPSDLGCWMACDGLEARGARPRWVKVFFGESRGSASGGTIASALAQVEAMAEDRALRRLLADPYALCPLGSSRDGATSDQKGIRFDADLGMWTAPFVMAMVNSRVVRRSLALRGGGFEVVGYEECMSTGRGARGLARAVTATAGLGAALAALRVAPLRRSLEAHVLPKPGEGPSREARDAGYFVMRVLAEGETPSGERRRVRGLVRGEKDPGYGETAKMLAESVLCLALDDERLPVGGGSWTPATAMGPLLLERLRRAGMTFTLDDA